MMKLSRTHTASRRRSILCLALVLAGPPALSQENDARSLFIHGGFARPVGPQHFFDYWKDGFVAGGGIGFPFMPEIQMVAALDFSRFAVDKDRLFKGLDISGGDKSFSGGASSIVTFSGALRYFPTDDQEVPLFVTTGIALALSYIAESKGEYSGVAVQRDGEWNGAAMILLGGGVRVNASSAWSWFLEGRVHFSVVGGENGNYNYSSIRIVASKPLHTPAE